MKIEITACYEISDYYNYWGNDGGESALCFCFDCYHNNIQKEKLIDLIKTYKNNAVLIVFGTVHDTIPNIIGGLIYNKILSKEQVKFVLYDEEHKRTEYHYDDNGFLLNWKYGWFEVK